MMHLKKVILILISFSVAWGQSRAGVRAPLLPNESLKKQEIQENPNKTAVSILLNRIKTDEDLDKKFNKKTLQPYILKKVIKDKSLQSGGGWGSSGGGGGVACFQRAEDAAAAEKFITDGVALTSELKSKITSVVTLDFWEWQVKWKKNDNFELMDTSKDDDFNNIVLRAKENMSFIAPLFIYRLNQIGSSVKPSNWIQKDVISRIYDSKPKEALPENCRLVQLVARYTKQGKYKKAEALNNGKKPTVKIEVDQDLFSRLDPLNKAILVLHEEMYLLGQIIGYSSSDNVRPIVMKFFSKILEAKVINTPLDDGMRVQLVSLFGDYVMFFGKDEPISGVSGSQESRFRSFYKMMKRIRSNITSCYTKQGVTSDSKSEEALQIIKTCKDQAMYPSNNESWFDDEMSFIFISYYFISISLKLSNGELILAPLKSEAFRKASESNALNSCQWIEENQIRFQTLQQKATRYCEAIKANLTPMEKDQN